jgi:hypothetical protein
MPVTAGKFGHERFNRAFQVQKIHRTAPIPDRKRFGDAVQFAVQLHPCSMPTQYSVETLTDEVQTLAKPRFETAPRHPCGTGQHLRVHGERFAGLGVAVKHDDAAQGNETFDAPLHGWQNGKVLESD